jgi:uncharacterized protein (TIGR00255 family)
MTGHGSAHLRQDGIAVTVELRTINNRYYKLALRTTEGYASLESRIDDSIRQTIRRGTVQVDLRLERESAPEDFRLSEVALASYLRQLEDVRRRLQVDGPVHLEHLLVLPGVVNEQTTLCADVEHVWPIVQRALQQALGGLSRMRSEEGRTMEDDLADNCRVIGRELSAVEQLAPRVVESYRQRLTEKINKLLNQYGVTVEAAEVVREVVLFDERSDI